MSQATSRPPQVRVHFGLFDFDSVAGELRRDGSIVRLQRHPSLVLAALVERRGDVVTRDELRALLWADGTHVEFEDGLNTAVARLRRALGDDADRPTYIQTVPGRGYRFIAPAQPRTSTRPVQTPASRSGHWRWGLGLALGVAAAAVLARITLSGRTPTPRVARTFQLTTAPGLEQRPTWSPEGTRLAFTSDQLGKMDVWVRQLGTDAAVPLTKDISGDAFNPAWSPDGGWIAFASSREGGGIDVMPAVGGPPRRLTPLAFAPSPDLIGSVPTLAWSPDGSHLTYGFGIEGRAGLYVVPAAGGTPSAIALPAEARGFSLVEPAWSPDGRRLAFATLAGSLRTTARIWIVPADGRSARALTDGRHLDRHPAWSPDGRSLLFLSDRGGTSDVWNVAIDGAGSPAADPAPVTLGAGVGTFGLSRDGRYLAYSKQEERSNIWSLEMGRLLPLRWDEARPLTSEDQVVEFLELSRDGAWIAFDSTRGGNSNIWVMRSDGSALRRVTDDRADEWHPSLSPDASEVAFHRLMPDGNREIFKVALAGGPAVRLTDRPAKDWCPRWSPDGLSIAFATDQEGDQDVAVVPSTGGEVRTLARSPANDHNPLWSPDSRRILFASNRGGGDDLYLVPGGGGEPTRLTRVGWEDVVPLCWREPGRIYVWARGGAHHAGYWSVRAQDGVAEPILSSHLSHRQFGIALGTDGHRLLFPAWERVADLWVAELGR